jgi:hypothetical protein
LATALLPARLLPIKDSYWAKFQLLPVLEKLIIGKRKFSDQNPCVCVHQLKKQSASSGYIFYKKEGTFLVRAR